jgi:phosphomannomutase
MTEAASVYPSLENRPIKNTVVLFDVDETLTPARRVGCDGTVVLDSSY